MTTQAPLVVLVGTIDPTAITPWVLLDNRNYNPAVTIGRFSARPLDEPVIQDALLAADMVANGQRNPVCLWAYGGKLWVAYGASRVRAARKAGLSLKAVVSGPPEEFMAGVHTASKRVSVAQVWSEFTDLPLHWRIEPEGFLYFDGCVSPWDETNNPKGVAALRARSYNNPPTVFSATELEELRAFAVPGVRPEVSRPVDKAEPSTPGPAAPAAAEATPSVRGASGHGAGIDPLGRPGRGVKRRHGP